VGQRRGGIGGTEKFRSASTGVGETTKPIGGARVAMTEGEGVVAGLRKLEEETAFGKYAKAAQVGMGRARVRGLREKRGASGAGWAERPDGPAGRWAECEGKILFRIKFDFLIIARLWKIVEGDFGGILT
jgi:hypothetical protein